LQEDGEWQEAKPLKDINSGDGNLQDLGLHMQLVIATPSF